MKWIDELIDDWCDRPTITRHSHKEQIEGIEDLVAALKQLRGSSRSKEEA